MAEKVRKGVVPGGFQLTGRESDGDRGFGVWICADGSNCGKRAVGGEGNVVEGVGCEGGEFKAVEGGVNFHWSYCRGGTWAASY